VNSPPPKPEVITVLLVPITSHGHRKPKFNKISSIKENVKTLGVTMFTMIKFGRTLLIE
jgi:hypothetical protein